MSKGANSILMSQPLFYIGPLLVLNAMRACVSRFTGWNYVSEAPDLTSLKGLFVTHTCGQNQKHPVIDPREMMDGSLLLPVAKHHAQMLVRTCHLYATPCLIHDPSIDEQY